MKRDWIHPLFILAAVYDFGLGVVVLTMHPAIFTYFGVTPPNHAGYVELPAALIAIFGVGFWLVARDPWRNRDIIKLGILVKLAYAGIVLGYAARGAMPGFWIPWAWADLGFAGAFVQALRALSRSSEASA
jgi:hypothetical protein